ncbi:MAG: leucine-rich repeat domain-containing protein [Spirochaetaceae bacterium]|jgi:hypothetical protein|nr:leucine-rich repeat domain-containing protein [Spirochaetaceae bacterium]
MNQFQRISLKAVLVAAFLLAGQTAFAESEGDFEYEAVEGGVSVTGYKGPEGVSLDIPDKLGGKVVVMIGVFAFDENLLTSVTIPSSVTSIGDEAFTCDTLLSFEVDVTNKHYKSIDGILFSKDGTVLCAYPDGKDATSYSIPSSVIAIVPPRVDGARHFL